MKNTFVVFKRELRGYFATPVAYVFLCVFLILSGVFTWSLGGLYENDQADLQMFFGYHPWLYVALIPAISMRLWAEERRGGTIELLLTLPITMGQAVAGKFLAAWAFCGIALLLTTTNWISVSYLGDPDHGVIFASYMGSFLMAGAFLAIGSCMSSLTKNQVIAFVMTVTISLAFILAGWPAVLDAVRWAPDMIVESISSFSFYENFQNIQRGKLDARNFIFFVSVMVFFLYTNALVVDTKKAQ